MSAQSLSSSRTREIQTIMKKSIAGLIAAVALTVSLVATGGVAHADPICCDQVATTTTVMSPSEVTRGKPVWVCAEVTMKSGASIPTGSIPAGSITFMVRRIGSSTITITTVAYSGGGEACITTAPLKRTGGRGVAAAFSGGSRSVWADSTGVGGFNVVKKRHH